ncbi:hypothetical protein LshimejAT787_1402370 [Lyophyllum shimeji]|uniref:Uncharacterized protein n=1 Tax=Lyophyllum shimeji TaxID=47721 RepID=A0A9P3PVJ0_LYOSH|nr:hypothetical protein LshimejAT787_1402370 [Lyophyllum shimeji]
MVRDQTINRVPDNSKNVCVIVLHTSPVYDKREPRRNNEKNHQAFTCIAETRALILPVKDVAIRGRMLGVRGGMCRVHGEYAGP